MKIKITIGDISMEAELNNTPTAEKVAEALPIRASFSTWGDEIYFTIPVDADLDESAREEVEMGDLGYWPTGKAFCIFFGQTPMSTPGKIIPASAVNMIGKVMGGDATKFKEVMKAREVILEAM
ncbi:MAG: cyclophilin-like fold protein [Pseudomonadota bacterium]